MANDKVYEQPDGTNASLTFNTDASLANTVYNAVRVRVRKLDYNWEVIAKESHARIHRAMYPHQRAVGQFALTIELKGYREFKPFSDFMWNYIKTFMGANRKAMFVSMPVRGFARWGIPVSGIYDGDHVGSMVFSPTIVFEGMNDPLDPNILTTLDQVSSWDYAGTTGDQANFFYPFSTGSRDSSVRAETLYDAPTGFAAGVSGAIDNAVGTVAGNVGGAIDQLIRGLNDQQIANGTVGQ